MLLVIKMEQDERKKYQKKLANLFLEMGMDLDLISKVSGVSKEEIINNRNVDKKGNNHYNSPDKTKNDSY